MRKCYLLLSFLVTLKLFAQSQVSKNVDGLLAQNVKFERFSVFTVSPEIENADTQKAVDRATFAKLNRPILSDIVQNQPEYIELEIPYLDQMVALQLYKVDLFAQGFHLDTDKVYNVDYQKGVHYRGKIKGDADSVATFNFFDGQCNGIFSGSALVNVVVGKLERSNSSDYIIYSDTDLKVRDHFDCKTDDAPKPTAQANPETVLSARCITMYLEVDYSLYQQNGSLTATANWMTSVFNNVQTIYTNDGISIALRSSFIWTTPDPYDNIGTDSADYLDAFQVNRPLFDAEVAHLLGIDPGGMGGRANMGYNLCDSYGRHAYADVNLSYSTVPVYSWTIKVIAHETGHLLGSPHTHACLWNGNNTAIDGCGPAMGYTEGDCPAAPIPSSTVKGTVMSYCHLVSGVGVNLANGFGPQPAALIVNNLNGSTCLSSDCINVCINTVTNIQSDAGIDTATITWDDLNPVTNHWRISVTPFSQSQPAWNEVTTNSYTAEGLSPNTFYRIRIQPMCQAAINGFQMSLQTMQTAATYCDGITFTNPTGFGYYSFNQDFTRTIVPSSPNQKIRLNFNDFGLTANDYLYIYNGNSTLAPDLSNGGLTGSTNPGEFISSAPDGALTLRFVTDNVYLDGSEGYIAFADCISTLGTESNEPSIDFKYYPNPTSSLVTIESRQPITEVSVYNVAGQLLYRQSGHALQTQVDLAAYASGTYFFKLQFNDLQANFKIYKM